MNELALFAGAGGGILGGKLLGWRTVCAVERDAYAAQVLAQRQNDGHLEPFPIWSDVTSFDGKPWRGIVDVVSGGFPCQDISVAGKGAGITGARSGLWKEFARIIGEVRPRYAFIENSPALVTRGLGTVLCDLAAMGFNAEWGVVSAADVGAVHRRERLWIVAHSKLLGVSERWRAGDFVQNTNGQGAIHSHVEPGRKLKAGKVLAYAGIKQCNGRCNGACWWQREPKETLREIGRSGRQTDGLSDLESELDRVANGVAGRLDRLKAIGNGQVPLCAATAWEVLTA